MFNCTQTLNIVWIFVSLEKIFFLSICRLYMFNKGCKNFLGTFSWVPILLKRYQDTSGCSTDNNTYSGLKCIFFILNLEIKKKISLDHFWGRFFGYPLWLTAIILCLGCNAALFLNDVNKWKFFMGSHRIVANIVCSRVWMHFQKYVNKKGNSSICCCKRGILE